MMTRTIVKSNQLTDRLTDFDNNYDNDKNKNNGNNHNYNNFQNNKTIPNKNLKLMTCTDLQRLFTVLYMRKTAGKLPRLSQHNTTQHTKRTPKC